MPSNERILVEIAFVAIKSYYFTFFSLARSFDHFATMTRSQRLDSWIDRTFRPTKIIGICYYRDIHRNDFSFII